MPSTTRSKTITAEITAHYIDLVGDTYTVRRDIQSQGGVWNADKQHWRVAPVTDAKVTWVKTLAHTVHDNRTNNTVAPTPETKPMTTTTITTTDTIQTVDVATDTPVTRRRITRTATPDDVAINPIPQTDAATAFKTFLEAVGGLPTAPVPQQTLDVDQVKSLIMAALEPIVEALNQRPTTSVTVTSPDTVRTIDGLSHKMLPDLIKCVSTGMNVWLSGPSQAGKTTAAKQCAKALGLDYYAHGSINMAHELLGFVDAGGTYHETQFVKAYRNGGVVLLDEVDRGSNEGCLSMQMALANGHMPLPDGTMLERHPNFRCIAAGNTWGGGATSDYVGAARLDAAFLQRFPVKLHWDYDAALELQLTPNVDWAMRVQQARAKAQSNGLKVMITPQSTIAAALLISAGYTSDQAANMTYLAGLSPDQRRMIG